MSLSASAENLATEKQQAAYDGSSNMCLELAIEGERLCKSGDCRAGVAFFQAAIQAGTDDLRTLSAIYSQLGNAYFYLGDYNKAMLYHKHDLTLARTLGDKLGEAKSSGNLGNTLKVMGRFDEAVVCCRRHLELSRELEDQLSEGRALYNLGNVFHAKGKHIGRVGSNKDNGELSEEVKTCLQEAVNFYEENLTLMRNMGDIAAQGRACGNLGNTYYLLGEFGEAIRYHQERLSIAKQFGDRPAERRAHSNLGNSNIFMGQFEEAAFHYKRTLSLAQQLGDRAVEAQACYSLGNTYTLLRNYETAIDYHLRHMVIAQQLGDRVGEGRACWSLGNAHASLNNHSKALQFALRHLDISKELNDRMGIATAKMNISDLRKVLNLPESSDSDDNCSSGSNKESSAKAAPSDGSVASNGVLNNNNSAGSSGNPRVNRVRRESMEQLDLIKLTPDGKQRPLIHSASASSTTTAYGISGCLSSGIGATAVPPKGADDEDSFFDLVSRFQSKRMDDQRCTLLDNNKENRNLANLPGVKVNASTSGAAGGAASHNAQAVMPVLGSGAASDMSGAVGGSGGTDDLLDLIVGMQSKRMDEQRAVLPRLPGLQGNTLERLAAAASTNDNNNNAGDGRLLQRHNTVPDDNFLEQLVRCQESRLNDQRSPLPPVAPSELADPEEQENPPSMVLVGGAASAARRSLLQLQQRHSVDGAPSVANAAAVAGGRSGSGGGAGAVAGGSSGSGATVPDEDFFSLIMRLQASGRMDDQRATVPGRRGDARVGNGTVPFSSRYLSNDVKKN